MVLEFDSFVGIVHFETFADMIPKRFERSDEIIVIQQSSLKNDKDNADRHASRACFVLRIVTDQCLWSS